MKKLFIPIIVAGLGIIVLSTSTHADNQTFDGKGNLFFVDEYLGTIFKFTPDGQKTIFTSELMPDFGPYNVAFDRIGNLFLSEQGSESICKFTPDGKKTTFATGVRSRDLIFDKAGNLFVPEYSMDYANHSIFKFTPDGKKSTFASDVVPHAVAFDSAGNLFVSDGRSKSILKFTPDGKKSTFASGVTPIELDFDHSGNLFVADNDNRSILKFTPDGKKSTFASDPGASDRGYDIVFDPANNLFVVDSGRKAIFKFGPDGTKSTFASGDFLSPAFDKAGNLYVWENGSILKFAADGARSTFAASDEISPDKKWEYVGGDEPKIVRAGTNEVALDLSDSGPGGVIWAPDSKRFALNWGRGRSHSTSLYQLRDDKWKELKSPDDKASKRADDIVAAQLKTHGLSEKKLAKKNMRLRLISWTPRLTAWVDPNTAIMHASLRRVAARRDAPGEMLDDDFGADLLFTLKFNDGGNWKVVKMQRMSEKGVEKKEE